MLCGGVWWGKRDFHTANHDTSTNGLTPATSHANDNAKYASTRQKSNAKHASTRGDAQYSSKRQKRQREICEHTPRYSSRRRKTSSWKNSGLGSRVRGLAFGVESSGTLRRWRNSRHSRIALWSPYAVVALSLPLYHCPPPSLSLSHARPPCPLEVPPPWPLSRVPNLSHDVAHIIRMIVCVCVCVCV